MLLTRSIERVFCVIILLASCKGDNMSGIFVRYQLNNTIIENADKELIRWTRPYGTREEVLSNSNSIIGCIKDDINTKIPISKLIIEDDDFVSSFDVLLYNRQELLAELGTDGLSDEILLFRFIKQFGINALSRVNGDFAGIFINKKDKRLILFRDHMGIRPLYYTYNECYIACATEIRAICGMNDFSPQIDKDWLYKAIAGLSPLSTENTSFENIHCVPPGGYVEFDLNDGGMTKGKYWSVGSKKIRLKNDSAYIQRMRELIEDSIKRRLATYDGLVGAELSGGLDSAVIDILINRFGREAVFYSWSASPDAVPYAEGDERLSIKDICDQEGIVCNYSKLRNNISEASRTAMICKELGVYSEADGSSALKYAVPPFANTLKLAEGAEFVKRNGANVMFTGHGGDEGVSHRCNLYELYYHKEYYHYFRNMWSRTHGQKNRIGKFVGNCRKNILQYKNQEAFVSVHSVPEILSESMRKEFDNKPRPVLSFAYDSSDYVNTGGSRPRLDNLALQGGFSGVRYFVPFLDYRVIDYAISIPRYLYMKGKTNRYIYREAFKDILPKRLYKQTEKRDTSYSNITRSENWFDAVKKQREYIFSNLDWNFWKEYLNKEEIEKWLKRGKPESDEAELHDDSIESALYGCLIYQNCVEKSKLKK